MPTRQRLRLEDELRPAGAHELLAVIRDTQRKGSIAGDGYASLIRKLGLDLLPQDDRFRLLDALRDGTDSQDDTVATALLKVRVLVSKMEEVAQSAGLDCRIRFKDENEIFPFYDPDPVRVLERLLRLVAFDMAVTVASDFESGALMPKLLAFADVTGRDSEAVACTVQAILDEMRIEAEELPSDVKADSDYQFARRVVTWGIVIVAIAVLWRAC